MKFRVSKVTLKFQVERLNDDGQVDAQDEVSVQVFESQFGATSLESLSAQLLENLQKAAEKGDQKEE